MLITEYDQEKVLEKERQEALNEGMEKGIAKGRQEVQKEVATDMLREGGQSVSFIARISRLPESAVRSLAKELHITVL